MGEADDPLDETERFLAELIGTAVGEDLREALPKIRARVDVISRLDNMSGIAPNSGDIVANTYISYVVRAIEELRPA
jgi:hypothetical protein